MSHTDNFRISAVLNVYKNDQPELFEKALKSVLDQSYPANEVLIVKNGPVPKIISEIISKYSINSSIVSLLEIPKNLSRGLARHKGILATKNRYVALMDADDQSCRNRFKVQIEKIKMNQVDVVGGQIKIINFVSGTHSFRNVPLKHDEIIKLGKKRYPFNNVTLMFDKVKYSLLNYEQTGNLIEDYSLFAEFIKNSWRMANVSEKIVDVNFSSRDYERRSGLEYLKEELYIQKKLLSIKYINKRQYFYNVILRVFVRLIVPIRILAILTESYFRSKKGM